MGGRGRRGGGKGLPKAPKGPRGLPASKVASGDLFLGLNSYVGREEGREGAREGGGGGGESIAVAVDRKSVV